MIFDELKNSILNDALKITYESGIKVVLLRLQSQLPLFSLLHLIFVDNE